MIGAACVTPVVLAYSAFAYWIGVLGAIATFLWHTRSALYADQGYNRECLSAESREMDYIGLRHSLDWVGSA